MSRPDEHRIWVTAKLLDGVIKRSRSLDHRSFKARRTLQQVRSAHVSDEEKVSGERPVGLFGSGAVRENEADVLRGMARRVYDIEPETAHADGVTVVKQLGGRALSKGIFPVGGTLVGQIEFCTGSLGQFQSAAYEVGMDVSLGYRDDLKALFLSGAEVLVDVTKRIDNNGLAGLAASHKVAGLGQLGVVKVFEDHFLICSFGSKA